LEEAKYEIIKDEELFYKEVEELPGLIRPETLTRKENEVCLFAERQ